MKFLGVVRTLYPAIHGLASMGGPLGVLAANMVGKALGVDKIDPTPEAITAAIAGATPEQMIALKQVEVDAQLKVQEMGFKDVETMMQAADGDAADARKREEIVRDRTPEIGFYVLIAAFVGVIIALFRIPVPADNKAVVFSMIGSLGTIVIGATQYFYGTTRSSGNKDQTIADIAKS